MAVAELLDEDVDVEPQTDYTEVELPKGFELIDGELTEMTHMGFEASWVASRIAGRLDRWTVEKGVGVTMTAEASYCCFPHNAKQIRKPDVSVLLCDPETFIPPDPHCLIAPAIVIESVSPHETADDLDSKIDDFLRAGTTLVWEIRPTLRIAIVHYPDRTTRQINEDGVLTGEDVLPGFSVPLKAILPKQV